jgi:tRNA nucleotidyltransferase/poly(A) polymerase
MEPTPPAAVLEIARRLRDRGYKAWAVGGAMRDALVGAAGGDWDLATDARPDDVRRVFRRTVPVGIEHGTVGVLAPDGVLYEVTTFRRDVETFGRRAVVEFASTIDEDLARRDFTINAMAWDPLTGEVRDPFGGLDDLRNRRLRTVGDPRQRMAEDYLRVLRALRFAGHYGLEIDAATWSALTEAVPKLEILSSERVRDELSKVLGKTRRASVTLQLYADSSALRCILPELADTIGVETGSASGRDAWSRALAAVDAVPPVRTLVRFAALLHTVGYPAARTRDLRGGWRFTGHESVGARKSAAILRRLRASNADTERVAALVGGQSDLFPPDAPDAGIRRWLIDVPPERVFDLFRLRIAMWRADRAPRGDRDLILRWRKAHRVLLARPVLTLDRLAVTGEDLKAIGLEPGPRFGEILRDLLARVIEDPALNRRESLLEIVEREHLGR